MLLKKRFVFLDRQATLVIFVLTTCVTNAIGKNTIYTTLKINIKVK